VTKEELTVLVKEHLNISGSDRDLDISDLITAALEYCNIPELPEALEPWLRKKVKTIINYEAENGDSSVFDVKSLHEGDTTTNYNVDQVSRETIYGLSKADKAVLQRYRRLRK
jgi:hypothetical protein